ncbi:glycosyltransferase [Actinomycetospora lutea]|uniref:glycosyltransferase n=1 Tax=Actinomycetospora lutea TaxID=663604 RepID=UPI00236705AB|nr:glycosyltransferase [Actinomycetospora lutea]MDD7939053.1 glycosyltransferase [Actinomycetospora lutea]
MTELRICALTSYGEHTALTGGRLRRDNLLRALAKRGHHVARFDVPSRPGPRSAVGAVRVVAQRAFRDALARSDIVLLGDVFCLPSIPLIRRSGIPIVLDLVDSPYRLVSSGPRRTVAQKCSTLAGAAQLVPVMQLLYPLVSAVTYISDDDASWDTARVRRGPRTHVVPNGIAAPLFELDLCAPPDDGYVAWLADWTYAPNRDSLRWFVEEVAPRLPDTVLERITLFGAGDPWTISAEGGALERSRSRMAFAGFVDRLADVYRGARAVVAPVTRGAGVNNKVLEPLAAGRPLVTTVVGTRGLPPAVLDNIRYAADGAGFAAELRALLSATWEPASARAARASVDSLSWDRAGALMENVLVGVAQRHGTTASHGHAR